MIRKWLFKILNEVLESHFISFHRNLEDDLNARFEVLQQGIEQLATVLGEVHRALHGSDSVKQEEQIPLHSSRPSWPRMKRQLEERDVRAIIAQNVASQDFETSQELSSRMSREAQRVESYWKRKSENASGYHGIGDLEKGL